MLRDIECAGAIAEELRAIKKREGRYEPPAEDEEKAQRATMMGGINHGPNWWWKTSIGPDEHQPTQWAQPIPYVGNPHGF